MQFCQNIRENIEVYREKKTKVSIWIEFHHFEGYFKWNSILSNWQVTNASEIQSMCFDMNTKICMLKRVKIQKKKLDSNEFCTSLYFIWTSVGFNRTTLVWFVIDCTVQFNWMFVRSSSKYCEKWWDHDVFFGACNIAHFH